MDYPLFGHLLSYIQMMAALDLALIFIDKDSLVMKLQTRIMEITKGDAYSILSDAESLAGSCDKSKYSTTDSGRRILGIAESIKNHVTAFQGPETNAEKLPSFMPALGLMSGFFCIIYMIWVPFLLRAPNEVSLHFLIFTAEATLVSQCVTILTLFMKDKFPGYLSSLATAILWFLIPIVFTTILYLLDATIECFGIDFYLFLFILLPMMPILVMMIRILYLRHIRRARVRLIKNKAAELHDLLEREG